MDAYAFSSWPTELTALLDWSGVPLDMASLAANEHGDLGHLHEIGRAHV